MSLNWLFSWKALAKEISGHNKPTIADRLSLIVEDRKIAGEAFTMLKETVKEKLFGKKEPVTKDLSHLVAGLDLRGIVPYQFQLENLEMCDQFAGRVLLADEQGLGKTLTTLFHALRHPELRPIVVVCPATIKWKWHRECASLGFKAQVLGSQTPSAFTPAPVVIINYNVLPHWLERLKKFRPKMLVFDEIHNLSNPKAKRTKAAKQLSEVDSVSSVFGLSGTPITDYLAKLWPILNIIRPDKYYNPYPFLQKFCKPTRRPWGIDFKGAENTRLLNHRLRREVMIRHLMKDVFTQLPQEVVSVEPLELSKSAMDEYSKALFDFAAWLKVTHPDKLWRALAAEALTKITYLKSLVAKLKIQAVGDWIENWLEASGQKLLVAAEHQSMVRGLEARFKKSCTVIDGNMNSQQKDQAADTFNKKHWCRVLIGSISAAEGWNCTATSAIANVELYWTPGKHDQFKKRVVGIGRGKEGMKPISYWLIARGTLEEKILQLLNRKQANITAVLDDHSPSGGDLNVFKELLVMMRSDLK